MGMQADERERCWTEFERGANDRRSAFRTPVVMSVDAEGYPSGRVLTLREADPKQNRLRFHLDRRSPKYSHWLERPHVSLLFYDAPAMWQVRVKGTVAMHWMDEVTTAAWASSHPMSKRTYLSVLAPGMEIDWDDDSIFPEGLERRRPTEQESALGFERFVVLYVQVAELDSLHLVGTGHHRFNIIGNEVKRIAP